MLKSLFLFVFLWATAFAAQEYHNPSQVFTIVVPEGWELWETQEGDAETVRFRSPFENKADAYHEGIIISYYNKAIDESLEKYVNTSLQKMESFADFSVVEMGYTDLSGIKAFRYVFTGTLDVDKEKTYIKALQYIALVDGHPFIITAIGPEGSYPRFEKIYDQTVKSIQLR